MHYRHRFHAGNFADVFKHVLLVALLRALNTKDKPWCYLETHAGAGRYDFTDEAAARTAEYREGIERLWPQVTSPPAVTAYLEAVRALNPDGQLRYYPGSPLLVQHCVRPQDRMLLCEKLPEVAQELRDHLASQERAHVHVRNGYEAIALLPPAEKRGLVLIDPPFEGASEFESCAEFLVKGVQRFNAGVFAVWYPYKNRHATERWLRRVQRDCKREILNLTMAVGLPAEGQMRACGLLVVNPPYTFRAEATEALAWLAPRLKQGPGSSHQIEHWPVAAG